MTRQFAMKAAVMMCSKLSPMRRDHSQMSLDYSAKLKSRSAAEVRDPVQRYCKATHSIMMHELSRTPAQLAAKPQLALSPELLTHWTTGVELLAHCAPP
jgi:hypothetical protein